MSLLPENRDRITWNDGTTLIGEATSAATLRVFCGSVLIRKLTPVKSGDRWLFELPLTRELLALLPRGFPIEVIDLNGATLPHDPNIECAKPGLALDGGKSFLALLSQGYFVDKWGSLKLPFSASEEKKLGYARCMGALTERFKEITERDLFLHYGTLLGFKRGNSFLPHDDDVDLSFFVNGDFTAAADEFYAVANALKKAGIGVQVIQSGQMQVWLPGYEYSIDVFLSWGSSSLDFQTYFGVSGDISSPLNLEKVLFEGVHVNVPNEADKILEMAYGPNWLRPDPDFIFHRSPLLGRVMDQLKAAGAENFRNFSN